MALVKPSLAPAYRSRGIILAFLASGALFTALPASAQNSTAMQQCAARWNDMKAKDQTGDLTYRQFFQQCTASAASGTAPATTQPPGKPTTAPAQAAGSAKSGGSAKECADRWNDLKAKDQTGDLTYRQFSQSCMAGTASGSAPVKPTATAPAPKPATTSSRTSVPSAGAKMKPSATEVEEAEDETDKATLSRCNGEWKDYKARHNLTGAKAWHVFMAKCL